MLFFGGRRSAGCDVRPSVENRGKRFVPGTLCGGQKGGWREARRRAGGEIDTGGDESHAIPAISPRPAQSTSLSLEMLSRFDNGLDFHDLRMKGLTWDFRWFLDFQKDARELLMRRRVKTLAGYL
ncbi:hypothetical protein KM043_013131 [Ampulex compressa]|nr:hypothetical protein KM043_013131 [Ampulex compressa]